MGDLGNRGDFGAVRDDAGKPCLAKNPQISPQALPAGQHRRRLSREVTVRSVGNPPFASGNCGGDRRRRREEKQPCLARTARRIVLLAVVVILIAGFRREANIVQDDDDGLAVSCLGDNRGEWANRV